MKVIISPSVVNEMAAAFDVVPSARRGEYTVAELSANGNTVQLLHHNFSTFYQLEMPARVETPGTVCVRTTLLFRAFEVAAKYGDITLTQDGGLLEITSGNYSARLRTWSEEIGSSVPKIDGGTVTLNSDVFIEGIQRVGIAAGTNINRPVFMSIFLNVVDDRLILAATDSYRLAESVIDGVDSSLQGSITLDAKLLLALTRRLSKNNVVTLTWDESDARISCNGHECYIRRTEGQFPNYESHFENDYIAAVELVREDIYNSLANLDWLNTGKAAPIPVRIESRGDSLHLDIEDPEIGETSQTIPVLSMENDFSILLNPRFLKDALSATKNDLIIIRVADDLHPVLISDDESYRHIIMPIRSS